MQEIDIEKILKIYIDQGENASNFLDKAIFTLCSSILGGISLYNLFSTINITLILILGVCLIFLSFVGVVFSYLLSIYNTQLGIENIENIQKKKKEDKIKLIKKISKNMTKNNKKINKLRDMYCFGTIVGIMFIGISLFL